MTKVQVCMDAPPEKLSDPPVGLPLSTRDWPRQTSVILLPTAAVTGGLIVIGCVVVRSHPSSLV